MRRLKNAVFQTGRSSLNFFLDRMTSKMRLLVVLIVFSLVTNEAMGLIVPIRSKAKAKPSKAHGYVHPLLPTHLGAAEPKGHAVEAVEKIDHAAVPKVSKRDVTKVLASRVDDALRQYTSRLALTQMSSEPAKTTLGAVDSPARDSTGSEEDFAIRLLPNSATPQQQRLTTIMVIANGDTLLPNDFNTTDSADSSTILLGFNATALNGTANSTILSNMTANGTISDSNSTVLNETASVTIPSNITSNETDANSALNITTPQQQQRLPTIVVAIVNNVSADTLMGALNATGAFTMSDINLTTPADNSTIVLDYNSTALNETANSTIQTIIPLNGTDANSTLSGATTVASGVVADTVEIAGQPAGSNGEVASPAIEGVNSTDVSDSGVANSTTATQIELDYPKGEPISNVN